MNSELFVFVLGILVLVVSAVFMSSSKEPVRKYGFGGIAAAVVMFALACTTIVAPRTVGIVVSFGKPVASLSNGIHFKAPWAGVEKLDGAVQNDVYGNEHSIKVRLGNQSEAHADSSIQWQLRSEDAMGVFLDYRTFENIQQNLVDRNFRAVINEVMDSYDPLDMSSQNNNSDGSTNLKYLSDEVLKRMQERVGDQIDVKSVTIPILHFNQPTQDLINELQSEIARTRIAKQKQETAREEAEANRALESSLSEEVLISKCLDIIAENGYSPIGCFPGTNVQPYMQVGNETPTTPTEESTNN